MSPTVRIPANSPDAERAVLGAILLAHDTVYRVADALSPEDFYRSGHGTIFAAMLELARRGEPIDLVTLSDALRASGKLAEVGGATHLAELADAAVTASNIQYYARIVREHATLRALGATSGEIAARCYEPVEDVGSFVNEAEAAIFRVTERRAARSFQRAGVLLMPAIRKVEESFERQDIITGVPTGFVELDRLLGGLQRSNLIIVAARPSVGKTALCLNIAEFAAIERGIGVGIFSLEMSSEELVLRVLCSQAAVNLARLRYGRMVNADFPRLAEAASRIDSAPIYIDDTSALSVLDLHARARRLAHEPDAKLGLIIVDYLQLLRGAGRYENREREIGEISRSLKSLAKDLKLPVVALSQLNRESEKQNREPQLADLRDSGSIEQDADVIAFLSRKKGQDLESAKEVEVELAVKKHRNGPVGVIPLLFRSEFARFENGWNIAPAENS